MAVNDLLREAVRSLLPRGTAWNSAPDSWFSKFIDGIGDALDDVYEKMKGLADIRDPERTQILADLEREYGIIELTNVEESNRRSILAGRVYSKPGMGADDLEQRLALAGFKDADTGEPVQVWRNNDEEDPNYYLGGRWSMIAGRDDCVAGNDAAYCGLTGVGGKLLVNQSSEYSEEKHQMSATNGGWNVVFFVGGDRASSDVGYVVIEDGDLEAADTSAWTAGGGATLAKSTDRAVSGTQSLQITKDPDDFARQEVGIGENRAYLTSMWMRDNGDNVLRRNCPHPDFDSSTRAPDDPNNGVWQGSSIRHPVLDPGTNDPDPEQVTVSFDKTQGAAEPLSADNIESIGMWARVDDVGRDPSIKFTPNTSGYANLSSDLEIEGTTLSPVIRYEAKDADLTDWDPVAGETLTLTGAGNDPTIDDITAGLTDERVLFDGSARAYQGSTASVGAVGTKDIIFEAIITTPSSFIGKDYISKYYSNNDYVFLFQQGGGSLAFYLAGAAANNLFCLSKSALDESCVYHIMVFVDRTNTKQMRMFVNGVGGTPRDISALEGDIGVGVSGVWELGGNIDVNRYTAGAISYCSMWTPQGLLTTDNQVEVALRRATQAMGVNPSVFQTLSNPEEVQDLDMEAAGTSDWAALFNTLSKTSNTAPGSSGAQSLRLTPTGVASTTQATQSSLMLSGYQYNVTGWARGDGTTSIVPALGKGVAGKYAWTGTNSSTWQYFDVTFVTEDDDFILASLSETSTSAWVEFDDITITRAGDIPRTLFRSTTGHLEKWNDAKTEAYLVPVGAYWLRVDEYKDQDGLLQTGIRIEDAQSNLFYYTGDFSQANWVKTRCTINSDAATGLGEKLFDAVVASTDNDTHVVSQTITSSESRFVFSIYAEKGATDGLLLRFAEDTTQYAYFDLNLGTIGDIGSGFTVDEPVFIEDKGAGVYRCSIYVNYATGTNRSLEIMPATGSSVGNETFAGDGVSDYLFIYGAQARAGSTASIQSYVESGSSPYTGSAESFRYWGNENVNGSVSNNVNLLAQTVTFAPNNQINAGAGIVAINEDNTSANRFELYKSPVTVGTLITGTRTTARRNSGTSYTTLGQLANNLGRVETYESNIRIGNQGLFSDRTNTGTPTSPAEVPETMNNIALGKVSSLSQYLGGLIVHLEIGKHGLSNPRAIASMSVGIDESAVMLGYDQLAPESSDYELRGWVDGSGTPTFNTGTLTEGDWHHLGARLDGVDLDILIDGAVSDTTSDTTTLNDYSKLHLGWGGLKGYDETDLTTDWAVATGDVSIGKPQVWNSKAPDAWFLEMYNRGLPSLDSGLLHEICQRTDVDDRGGEVPPLSYYYDLVGGLEATRDENLEAAQLHLEAPYTEAGVALYNVSSHTSYAAADVSLLFDNAYSPFFDHNSHTYTGWVRLDSGVSPQTIWTSSGAGFNAGKLTYDSTNGLQYSCELGTGAASVSASVDVNRTYHVVVIRHYTGGDVTLSISLNGVEVASETYASTSPTLSSTAYLKMFANEADSEFFYGKTNANRFYDAAFFTGEALDQYNLQSAVIDTGPYATQTIEPTSEPFTFSGWGYSVGSQEYRQCVVRYQLESDGPWATLFLSDLDAGGWEQFEELIGGMNDFRLYVKDFDSHDPSGTTDAYYDDIDGGTEVGDNTVQKIKIPSEQKEAFEELILRRKPLHSWAVLVVEYV